jgi:hypothetical protein
MKILILEGLHGNNKGKKCQWRLKRTNLKVGDTVVLDCHDWKIIKVIKKKKRNVFPKRAIFNEYSTGFGNNKFYTAFKNKFKKEVKKVRPYFELKIVKVKKEEKKCEHSSLIQIQDMPYRLYQCANCGYYIYPPLKKNYLLVKNKVYQQKKKGNWVNEENLDKIKFPVPCTHNAKTDGYRGYGMLITALGDGLNPEYILIDIGKQRNELTVVASSKSLKRLIEVWNIHIKKGKIIIFEEE